MGVAEPAGLGVAEATPMASHPNGQTVALGGGPATPRAISKTTKKYIFYFFKY
jgi:hypothetical protein